MKKIFSFIVGLVAVTTLQAVNYKDAARITMSCSGGPETQQLDLIVDADQATPATEPNLASLYEVGQVNFYVAGNYSSYTANAISNLPVVIVTNRRDASYTFTFNVPISTEGLVLTDLRSNEGIKNIPMVNNGSYTFSVEDEDGYDPYDMINLTIADRFIINYDPSALMYNITLNGQYLATFSAPENVIIPDGLNAYTARFQGEQSLLLVEKIEGDYIPAGTGVILFNPLGGTQYSDQHEFSLVKYAGDVAPLSVTNDLKPSSAWVYPFEGTVYVLHESDMWLYNQSRMKPNKAFLHVQIGSGAPQRIRMVFSEEQGIESIAAEGKAVKFVENGRVFIKRGEKIYNVQGQLVK